MNVASRALVGDTIPAPPPMRVLPFTSPLRAIPGIDRVSRSRIYSRGAVVFHEGNIARGVYVLSSGRAKVSISSADGKKLIIRIARPGDVLGLYAGLTGRPFDERTGEGIRVQILLTQEEIAQIIGASRETVTRLFSTLKRDKIIRVKRDALWIRDSEALASLAQLAP